MGPDASAAGFHSLHDLILYELVLYEFVWQPLGLPFFYPRFFIAYQGQQKNFSFKETFSSKPTLNNRTFFKCFIITSLGWGPDASAAGFHSLHDFLYESVLYEFVWQPLGLPFFYPRFFIANQGQQKISPSRKLFHQSRL
ncbi:MAG TPA: hypothetical protein DEQ41_11305 [Shewanella sp.]|nr:hypothetical protein [Shewanella sp.]